MNVRYDALGKPAGRWIAQAGSRDDACDTPNLLGRRRDEKVPDETVDLSMMTISPGSMSRTYSALQRSSAHVSDATQYLCACNVSGTALCKVQCRPCPKSGLEMERINYPSVPFTPRPASLPMHNGRKPFGSRIATIRVSVRISTENSPSACGRRLLSVVRSHSSCTA